jgi:hypothetical protein
MKTAYVNRLSLTAAGFWPIFFSALFYSTLLHLPHLGFHKAEDSGIGPMIVAKSTLAACIFAQTINCMILLS